MLKKALAFSFLLLVCNICFATHNRAGYISYTRVPGSAFTYKVTITTYTKESSVSADRDSLPINWGDGDDVHDKPDIDTIPRINGPSVNGSPNGEILSNNIKYNVYVGYHTYPGFGQYVVSLTDPNRIQDIVNMALPVNTPFYIEDTLDIPDPQVLLGFNNSPIITKAPVDFGEVNQVFIYNPGAYDPDGDSLTYILVPPKSGLGQNVDRYIQPNFLGKTGQPTAQPTGSFTLDITTGQLTWATPQYVGTYNIAILITEWRRINGNKKSIYASRVGTTILDMEIIITAQNDQRPVIVSLHDSCIVAGSKVALNVIAKDPDVGQDVFLSAVGGPFLVTQSPATFTSVAGTAANNYIAKGTFTWNTVCDHISSVPYQVVFTAVDNYPNSPLTDVKVWNIRIVAPPPQNLTAVPLGNSIVLNWANPYSCSGADKFLGFAVWRKEGCDSIAIDTCTTGLNGMGYTRIADRLLAYTYIDNSVQRGKDYNYRILAEFSDTNNFGQGINYVESLASAGACAALKKDIPVITNVSIRNTDASSGSVYVAWSKPDPIILDTVQNPGPYKYIIYHSTGATGASFKKIDSITANAFYLLSDSTYIDSLVNTVNGPWSYKIEFASNNNSLGSTETASSVFLTIGSASHRLNLSWSENVPWSNASYTIYRHNTSTGKWDSIGITSSKSFRDTHLQNDSTYCYYVKSSGSYTVSGFINPIINLSQRVCAVPLDTVGPCAPVLTIINECSDKNFQLGPYVNQLVWTKPHLNCANDLLKYRIYYAASATDAFQLIDSSHYLNDTVFNHNLSNTIVGCYAVSGVDSTLNEGPKSAIVCVDACPTYNLPNVFTPNGDDKNDLFHPMLPYLYIDRIDMKIYDSWGVLVFQTTDPAINWDGHDLNNKTLPAGTYYYVCDVYESQLGGDVKRDKPLSGFIHLFR